MVKFYRPERWSEAQILEEHGFTLELIDAEIPIAPPLQIAGKTLHHYQGYLFALFASVGGRQFEVDNIEQLEGVGRFLGRIHKSAAYVNLSTDLTLISMSTSISHVKYCNLPR